MEFPQELFDHFYLPIKMPHSKSRMRTVPLKSGFMKCPCGYVYKHETERDMKMKLRMHLKICPNPPESCEKCKAPRKPMTMEEQNRFRTEQNRTFYN